MLTHSVPFNITLIFPFQ
ncbi:hypothetical protein F383_09100 [Gossypium arboreum]|uniref:Uncharacterized protein n=1 Tax=Gossypium arboreum TaxID=29729 RepID=A0A0B0NFK6_GOSAR|nr:hypothetical protein F383_12038 [Gossypium arboreum]KHG21454.1 hypothetical protein F383_09100 [Gossypium arboreum]